MSTNFKDLVWVVMDLDRNSDIVGAYTTCGAALEHAARLVGNYAYNHAGGDIYLFGPGSGNTSIMVRQVPRAMCKVELDVGR